MRLRLPTVVGVVAVLLGFGLLLARGVARELSLQQGLLVLVAVLALLQAARFVQERRSSDLREAETADPEQRYEAPTPGDDVAESLEYARRWSRRGRNARAQLRARVNALAVAAVMNERGVDEATAQQVVEDGEWTDDRVAASFLSNEVTLTRRERATLAVDSGLALSEFPSTFGRAVAAVEALSGGDVTVDPELADAGRSRSRLRRLLPWGGDAE